MQNYAIGFAQDEWKLANGVTLNYGLRYEYYTPLKRGRRQRGAVRHRHGHAEAEGHGVLRQQEEQLPAARRRSPGRRATAARCFAAASASSSARGRPKTRFSRLRATASARRSPADVPGRSDAAARELHQQPEQPHLPAARLRERVQDSRARLPVFRVGPARAALEAWWPRPPTSAARAAICSCATSRTGSSPCRPTPIPTKNAIIIREFDIVNRTARFSGRSPKSTSRPAADTTATTRCSSQLARRIASGLTLNSQYTLAKSYGNTAGSNEALTVGNPFDYDYDIGYNNFDVRHTFNLSALYSLPIGAAIASWAMPPAGTQAILGGWDVGAIVNARSGLPIDVRVTRPDVVYVDAAGNVFGSAAAGRTAVINTPGGGASRNVRRPNLIPGVDPYLEERRAVAESGRVQRSRRRASSATCSAATCAVRPSGRSTSWQRSASTSPAPRTSRCAGRSSTSSTPTTSAIRSRRCRARSARAPNQIQPEQPFTSGAAGTFGSLTSTVGRTVGLGTNRQMQFALRLNF